MGDRTYERIFLNKTHMPMFISLELSIQEFARNIITFEKRTNEYFLGNSKLIIFTFNICLLCSPAILLFCVYSRARARK